MDNLQYQGRDVATQAILPISFKPYYKWIIFNIDVSIDKEVEECTKF